MRARTAISESRRPLALKQRTQSWIGLVAVTPIAIAVSGTESIYGEGGRPITLSTHAPYPGRGPP
jgi:hypothetical protein